MFFMFPTIILCEPPMSNRPPLCWRKPKKAPAKKEPLHVSNQGLTQFTDITLCDSVNRRCHFAGESLKRLQLKRNLFKMDSY